MSLSSALALAAAFFSVALATSPRCHLHVSTSATPPFLGTPASPFSTISAAQAALRLGTSPRAASGPTRVCIAAGTYREALTFTAADSGAGAEAPIIYVGLSNVSVSGALPIAFAPLPASDPARAFVSPAIASQLLVADLMAAGVPDIAGASAWLPRGFGPYGGCQPSPLELVIDGAVQRTARWPNVDDASHGTTRGFALTEWHEPSRGLSNSSLWARRGDGSAPWLDYRDPSTLQMHGLWHFEWADGIVGYGGVVATDGDLVRVAFRTPAAVAGAYNETVGAARYFVTNAIEALDQEGEYYVNATGGRLYYWGAAAPAPGAAEVSVNTTLVQMEGTAHVWLVGITIEAARGHGVALTDTLGIALINVTLRNLGQDGVSAFSANSTLIAGASIRDTGCAGARFTGGGNRLTLTPSGNTIVDSEVTRVERLLLTYNPALQLDTGGVAAHNELHDAPHHCVGLDGNDVAILGNVIHNCTRYTFDNAVVYWFPEDWSKRNTTIRNNFFYLNAQDPSTCNSATSCNRDAIYPDNGSAGVLVESNVIYHPRPPASNLACPHCQNPALYTSYAVFEDGTRDCIKRNNILVLDGSNGTFNGAAGVTWDTAQQGNSSAYIAKLHAVQWDEGPYAARYPALAALHDWWPATGGALACAADARCGAAPWGNALTTNVVVGAAAVFTPPPPPFAFPGQFNNSNNLVTMGDPGWASADPRGDLDFSLRTDSPAWALGFQRIPSECFGPGRRCPGEPNWGAAQRAVALY
jgi:hypothetical protein